MRGIARDCLVELTARKSFWVYIVVTVLMVISLVVAGQFSFDPGPGDFEDFQNTTNFREFQSELLTRVYAWFVSMLVILTIFITAGQIPNMLVPGRAEFYLSKPVSRATLFVNKVLGIFLTYGIMIVVCGLVGWATIYLVFSFSSSGFWYVLLLNLASLFIWLTVTGFAGITFGTTSMAIVTAALVWFIQMALHYWRDYVKQLVSLKAMDGILDVLYYVFPKTGQIDSLTTSVGLGYPATDWMPLWSSLLFSVALLAITVVIFKRKNY